MRLRRRLALTLALAIVPTLGGLLYADAAARHRAAQERLVGVVTGHLDDEAQWRCEADPAAFGGTLGPPGFHPGDDRPPPPPRGEFPDEHPPPRRDFGPPDDVRPPSLAAYDEAGASRRAGATPLPADVLERARRDGVAYVPWHLGNPAVAVLVRTGYAGSCAYVLGSGFTSSHWGALVPENPGWILPVLAVYAAVLLAMGPLVGRLRRLTRQVQRLQAHQRDEAVDAAPELTIEGADEITDLARAFDESARLVRSELRERVASERALRDFLANTTHDVMIPLTVLQGHLTGLRDAAALGHAADPAVLRAAMDEAHYLGSLLHNLAIASKMDAAEPSLQRGLVDLGALVERVLARHRPVAKSRGVALEGATPVAALHADADVTVLEQAVSNVVYNAVRYNEEGGHVAVLLEREGPHFRIRVLDDGPGIPEAERARLLTRGARGDAARTRSPEGQGLGLYIARRAAELHGFTLSLAESEFGGLEVDLVGAVA